MRGLSDVALIDIWERGHRGHPVERALLLAAASPEVVEENVAELSIGLRDGLILRLRAAMFGSALQGYTNCPRCGECLEFDFDCGALPSGMQANREFIAGGKRFRCPNSSDLLALSAAGDADDAARRLLRRCCLDASSLDDGDTALLEHVEAALAASDPAADIRLSFSCVRCAHAWDDRLDIAAWMWDEIELRAQRLLDDVHTLATAYGWSEPQILALGDSRRIAYLDRCLA